MTTPGTPPMKPYRRHALICTGRLCDPFGDAARLYEQMGPLLRDLAFEEHPEHVRRGVSSCLGVCTGGPLMVVYPEGIWYHHLDADKLARIIAEHFRQDQPVDDLIFHRVPGRSSGA